MNFWGLSPLDWTILATYLAGIVALGSRFSQVKTQPKDFYLAGQKMSWFPVGLSTVAALISGNTYLGLPSEVRSHGLVYLIVPLSLFLAVPVTLKVFLPFFRGLQVASAYEYLERRFNVWVRCMASAMFVVWRLIWIAMVVYVPSLVFSAITGVSVVHTVIVLGVLTTFYTALGGIEGVIWTDVVQFFLMVGGVVLVIVLVGRNLETGLSGIWSIASSSGHTRMLDFSLDFTTRMTFWGSLVGGTFANLAYLGADQVVVQRYLTTKSFRDAKWSIWLTSLGTALLVVPLAFVGLALYVFYSLRPTLLPPDISEDKVFPHFIASQFPKGLVGLFIAAIFAATMSSLSSGINAITTALHIDFYQRLLQPREALSQDQNPGQVRFARVLSILIGLLTTILACFIGRLGTIIEIGLRFIDGFSGPLLGLFLLGMLSKRATPFGACLGSFFGIIVVTYVSFFSPISFMWYPAIGCLSTFLGGYLSSWFGPTNQAEVSEWVYSIRKVKAVVSAAPPLD